MARIMVVDDEPAVAQAIGDILESGGHDVVFPRDSRHPLPDVVELDYDLLITDVVMPETSGLELMRMAKMAHPEVPVLAISGGGGAITPQAALQMSTMLGARAALPKPIGVDALLSAVAEAMPAGRP